MHYPVDTLQMYILQLDPEAKYSPSGENTTLLTVDEKPMSVLMRFPLDTLHTPTVESKDPDPKCSPSGENTTLVTACQWSARV